ncbi:MAG: DUF6249 domain-containing protein [Chloroflexota bacterium]|nr:DUF6249 domain-containing protein [Chloroflexota bacterium]
MADLAVCAVPITSVIVIFGTIVLIRWFKHREVMAMVEKGVLPEHYAQYVGASHGRSNRGLLGWGITLAMLGLALMIGLYPIGFTRLIATPGGTGGSAYPLRFGPWMLIGLIPLFIGLALLITYFLTRKEEEAPAPEAGSVDKVQAPGD